MVYLLVNVRDGASNDFPMSGWYVRVDSFTSTGLVGCEMWQFDLRLEEIY